MRDAPLSPTSGLVTSQATRMTRNLLARIEAGNINIIQSIKTTAAKTNFIAVGVA